jgi:hypothetical protein
MQLPKTEERPFTLHPYKVTCIFFGKCLPNSGFRQHKINTVTIRKPAHLCPKVKWSGLQMVFSFFTILFSVQFLMFKIA